VSAAPGRILVVDDNRVNRLLLGRGLEAQGHSVEFAEHGRQALELLGRGQFDLMLLDVMMPEVDGYQVLAAMKDDPHLRDLPVIMTTSLDELDSVVKCIEMGAEDYLTKPVNPVLLKARVQSSLEKKRLRDQQKALVERFATSAVAQDLQRSGFSLGGKRVQATVMFCDIRGFTTIVESQGPEETIELLNTWYTLMFEAISSQGGVVNQMIGDGLMAVFGAPLPLVDPPLAARLPPADAQRIGRGLEVAFGTGRRLSSFQRGGPASQGGGAARAVTIGIRRTREDLRDRITHRVALMWSEGLLEEARRLQEMGLRGDVEHQKPIGYREAFSVLDGLLDPDEAMRRTVQQTVALAKRQMTWWRKREVTWLDVEPGEEPSVAQAAELVASWDGAAAREAGW